MRDESTIGTTTMKWRSAISFKENIDEALRECAASAWGREPAPPDLVVVFLTPHYSKEYKNVPKLVAKLLKPKHLLGCSAGGVIAAAQEAEGQPAVSLMAACLPDVKVTPFCLASEDLPDMDAAPKAWSAMLGIERGAATHFIVLADPFTFNPENLTYGLDYAFPNSVKIGGMASGAMRPGQNALFSGDAFHASGAVGVSLSGNIVIDPVVAQGCRPVGPQYKITRCEENQLLELSGKPVLEALEQLLEGLSEDDQKLARHSLFLGIINNPFKEGRSKRDYLIRNLVGLDPDKGVLAIGAMLRLGQVVQFHLRDKRTSAEDVKKHLKTYSEAKPHPSPAGALLFSCLGRGQNLYGVPNHDTDAFVKTVGQIPIGGFFCNGEIGPIDGVTYLHGYTSCFGIFRPATS